MSYDHKLYMREWYKKNKKKHVGYVSSSKSSVCLYIDNAKRCPCSDCGKTYPTYVMQFDHVRGRKLVALSRAAQSGLGMQRVKDEIAKCEVVCANCHAERTHQRLLLRGRAVPTQVS